MTTQSLTVLLAGCPNSGKSSLFNTLTGSKQKIGNYPGVTIERKSGTITSSCGTDIEVIDLPGSYSLHPKSIDEEIAFKILNEDPSSSKSQLIVAVADATNMERTLSLVLELQTLGKPIIMALNMMDLAISRGIKIDIAKLSRELSVPVVSTVAIKKNGVSSLLTHINNFIGEQTTRSQAKPSKTPLLKNAADRFIEIDRILSICQSKPNMADLWTHRIDRVLLHPVFGGPILFLLLLVMFQAVFSWAELPMVFIEDIVAATGSMVSSLLPNGWVQSLIVDGIIAGVGSVLVFLPQILILFLFILILESSGYMMRAAFIMDRIMASIGLQGRSFVPLLSSFACAIPGIMATRTIKDPKERLVTILIAPLMTCSARLPVYVLLISAFIPDQTVMGFLNLQGLTMFGLFIFAIFSAIVVAFAMRKTVLHSQASSFLVELPSYKIPNFKNVFLGLYIKAKVFLKKAGTLIMAVSIILWVLASFPKPPEGATDAPITYSYAGKIGKSIEPLVAPIGFDWRIATGLVPGFAAREVMVGALATVFSVEAEGEDEEIENLSGHLRSAWPLATGLSLLVWYIFSPQCLATFVVARKETNGWRWPIIMFTYMLTLAYLSSWLTYQITSFFSEI